MNNAAEQLIAQALLFIPKLGASLAIFVVFWLVAAITNNLLRRLAKRSHINWDIATLIAKVIQISLLVFGGVTALGTLGIDISAIVTGLGITGVALSLALKDILSNLIAGVLILVYQPFRRHDRIAVEGFEGEVIDIDLRYTTLFSEGKRVLIPNSALLSHTICIIQEGEGRGRD